MVSDSSPLHYGKSLFMFDSLQRLDSILLYSATSKTSQLKCIQSSLSVENYSKSELMILDLKLFTYTLQQVIFLV